MSVAPRAATSSAALLGVGGGAGPLGHLADVASEMSDLYASMRRMEEGKNATIAALEAQNAELRARLAASEAVRRRLEGDTDSLTANVASLLRALQHTDVLFTEAERRGAASRAFSRWRSRAARRTVTRREERLVPLAASWWNVDDAIGALADAERIMVRSRTELLQPLPDTLTINQWSELATRFLHAADDVAQCRFQMLIARIGYEQHRSASSVREEEGGAPRSSTTSSPGAAAPHAVGSLSRRPTATTLNSNDSSLMLEQEAAREALQARTRAALTVAVPPLLQMILEDASRHRQPNDAVGSRGATTSAGAQRSICSMPGDVFLHHAAHLCETVMINRSADRLPPSTWRGT